MTIDSVKNVTEGEAGRDYYSRVDDVAQQKERIAELKKPSKTSGREQRDVRKKELAEAELKLKELEAQARQLQKIMTYKGSSLLRASYQAPGNRSSRGGGGAMVTLEVSVALSEQDTKRLEKYQEAKSKKYSSRGGRWPIRIAGTVEVLRYDGRVVHVIVDGTWRAAPGGGDAETRDSRRYPRGRRPRGRNPRDRGNSSRRRPPFDDERRLDPRR